MFLFQLILFSLFIKGEVYDSITKSPIGFTNVYIVDIEKGTTTDSSGHFEISGLLPNTYIINFSHIAYYPKSIKVNLLENSLSGLKIFLIQRVLDSGKEIIVSAKRSRLKQEAVTPIIPDLPILIEFSNFIQPDFLRALRLLPSVNSANELTQVPYVAGGGAEHNLFIIDGIELYSPFHLSGGFSLLDVDILRKIDLYPAGFPARYGGKISSVIESEINEKSLNKRELSLGPVNSRLLIRQNLEPLAFLFSCHLNSFERLSKFFSKTTFPYRFYDCLIKFGFSLPSSWYFSLTGILGRDFYYGLDLQDTSKPNISFIWENMGISGNINKSWEKIIYHLNFGASYFGSTRSSIRTTYLKTNNKINRLSITNKLSYHLSNNLKLTTGFDLSQSDFTYLLFLGAISYYYSGSPLFFSHYLESEWKISKFLANFGLRFDYWHGSEHYGFVPLGELLQYYKYVDSLYIIISQNPTVLLFSDSLLFPHFNIVTKKGSAAFKKLSPRLALKFLLTDDWTLTFAGGKYYQFLAMFQPAIEQVIRFYNWLPIFENFDPQEADHFLIELLGFIKNDEMRIQGYYKIFPNLLLSGEKIDLLDDKVTLFRKGKGSSFGSSISYQHHFKDFTTLFGYSFGFSKILLPKVEVWADWDLRHSFSFLLNFNLGKNWNFSVNQTLNTGLPYTPIIGYYENEHLFPKDELEKRMGYTPIYGLENSERLPFYTRLDLTIRKKISKNFSLELQFWNLYNSKNIMMYDYDFRVYPPNKETLISLPFLISFSCIFLF